MSAAFGIQSDFQHNPNDPVMQTATKAMRPNIFLQFIANAVIPLLPYGRKFLYSEMGKKIFFKELFDLADVARNVVDIRRKGEVRKVSIFFNEDLEDQRLLLKVHIYT